MDFYLIYIIPASCVIAFIVALILYKKQKKICETAQDEKSLKKLQNLKLAVKILCIISIVFVALLIVICILFGLMIAYM